MKAKDEAEELVNKFLQYTPAEEEYEYPYAKQCALIAVDKILLNCYEVMKPFWEEVKQEIEKL